MRRSEWCVLALIVCIGAWLRFSHLELIEFKADEAIAAHLALQFVESGDFPSRGLKSSIGVTNPPLFIHLLIPMFAVTSNLTLISCFIALLGLCAVIMCWHVGRKYYGSFVGLFAASMFAVSPWAVIYSRKLWAQDFVPILSTATIWAMHSLILAKRPKTIFWVLLLPLATIQIHFSGFALTATAFVLLLVLRPKIDWRYAAAGVITAVLLAIPYIQSQAADNWIEIRRMAEQRSGRNWQIPRGMTIHPESGFSLPRRPSESWIHAQAIMNSGEIEDILGLSTDRKFDPKKVYEQKGLQYFSETLLVGESLLRIQRGAFIGAILWLLMRAVRSLVRTSQQKKKTRWLTRIRIEEEQRAWILGLWVAIPIGVFSTAGLWTYVSYYTVLYPSHFLATAVVIGALLTKFPGPRTRLTLSGILGLILLWNVIFVLDLYQFLGRNGGAQGAYGSGLGYKQAVASRLAEFENIETVIADQRLLQMDHLGRVEPAQTELLFLIARKKYSSHTRHLATDQVVLVVDGNRTTYSPDQVPWLVSAKQEKFGPMRLYYLDRN